MMNFSKDGQLSKSGRYTQNPFGQGMMSEMAMFRQLPETA
jgi:hypothetical protein